MRTTKNKATHTLFVATSIVGIVGWAIVFFLLIFWYLVPVSLPNVKTPAPILNENHEIAVGEFIRIELDVTKTNILETESAERFLICGTNLVTLAGTTRNLPTGRSIIVAEIELPNKVSTGDICIMNYTIRYKINPVRDEVLNFSSEEFIVVER